jgi:hypothetical protein
MKKQLIILIIGFIILDNSIPLQAIQQPAVDEVEMMLKKIEGNLKMASQVTSVAKSAGDKLVSNKVQEKAELKQAVSDAQAQVSELKKQNETFATRMVEAGIDTSGNVEDVNYSGPVWDDYQVYLKNGGTSDFEYFRLYRK